MKKQFFNILFLILLIILPQSIRADEAFVGYGVGVFNDASDFLGQMKIVEVGYRKSLYHGIYWQNKIGAWGEGSNDKTRKGSVWGATSLGMEMNLRPFEIRSGYGLAFISNPDSQLGSRFPQFNGELYLGVRDFIGDEIGFKYEHISSAGLGAPPNHGRDFIILELSQSW